MMLHRLMGKLDLAPVAGVVDRVPFTAVCWEPEVFLPADLTLRYLRRMSVCDSRTEEI